VSVETTGNWPYKNVGLVSLHDLVAFSLCRVSGLDMPAG